MNRRKLLQLISSIPAIAIPGQSQSDGITLSEDHMTYRGYALYWSGWIKQMNMIVYQGYWYAKNPDRSSIHYHGPDIYSAYPGATGFCWEGNIFDCSCYEDQHYPVPWSTSGELAAYRQDAFDRLIKFIQNIK